MNKIFLMWAGLALGISVHASESAAVVEVEIRNMACPVCARAVGERLRNLPGVQDVKISLKTDTARVVMAPGHKPDPGQLRKAVSDAGFEPGAVKLPAAAPRRDERQSSTTQAR